MARSIEKLFRAPYAVPNGLQAGELRFGGGADSRVPARSVGAGRAPGEQGLWIADQVTDRVALVRLDAPADGEYGVPWVIHEVATESSNTSGLTFGEGSLWLAANGPAARWRAARPTDAAAGAGEVFQVDAKTGRTRSRHPVPGGGGVHGIDYDRYDEGTLWVTTLKSQTLTQLRIADWSVRHSIPLPYGAAHGVVRVEDGIWVVHKVQWLIVKLDVRDGSEMDRIEVPSDNPEIHCLTMHGSDFLYCDATSGWVVKISDA